jgi:hypothetical protein
MKNAKAVEAYARRAAEIALKQGKTEYMLDNNEETERPTGQHDVTKDVMGGLAFLVDPDMDI